MAALLVVVLALVGWFAYQSSTAKAIDSGKYQAVFFTSGRCILQLKQSNDGYLRLTDVFYIQAQDSTAKDPRIHSKLEATSPKIFSD